jgi:hypothetical protein
MDIAPTLLPLVIKTPPAAPVVAPTLAQRLPITGSGDLHDRLAALEANVKAILADLTL